MKIDGFSTHHQHQRRRHVAVLVAADVDDMVLHTDVPVQVRLCERIGQGHRPRVDTGRSRNEMVVAVLRVDEPRIALEASVVDLDDVGNAGNEGTRILGPVDDFGGIGRLRRLVPDDDAVRHAPGLACDTSAILHAVIDDRAVYERTSAKKGPAPACSAVSFFVIISGYQAISNLPFRQKDARAAREIAIERAIVRDDAMRDQPLGRSNGGPSPAMGPAIASTENAIGSNASIA